MLPVRRNRRALYQVPIIYYYRLVIGGPDHGFCHSERGRRAIGTYSKYSLLMWFILILIGKYLMKISDFSARTFNLSQSLI